jgi:ParB family chromosome partitioning protein
MPRSRRWRFFRAGACGDANTRCILNATLRTNVFHVEQRLSRWERMPSMSDRTKSRRPRLGRGLSSLIVNSADLADDRTYQHVTGLPPVGQFQLRRPQPAGEGMVQLPVADIGANPYQPRRDFDEADLAALADSIAREGILQPIVVAAAGEGDEEHRYRVVAGERRLRAARQAGLETVPCVVREATAQQMLQWALIENIQRTDLNPIERAEAYRAYVDRFDLTQAEAAEQLGQPRATVANYLRLLALPQSVQSRIAGGALSFGHAKVLASLTDEPERQERLARAAVDQGLSVRALEELIAAGDAPGPPNAERVASSKPAYLRDLEAQLSEAVGMHVTIRPGRARHTGRVVIRYGSLDDFDRLTAALGAKLES